MTFALCDYFRLCTAKRLLGAWCWTLMEPLNCLCTVTWGCTAGLIWVSQDPCYFSSILEKLEEIQICAQNKFLSWRRKWCNCVFIAWIICIFVLLILLLASSEAQGAWCCRNKVGRWMIVHWTNHVSKRGLGKERNGIIIYK